MWETGAEFAAETSQYLTGWKAPPLRIATKENINTDEKKKLMLVSGNKENSYCLAAFAWHGHVAL